MEEFLAIDIGASSGRHILGRMEGGRLCLEEVYRFPNGPVAEDGGLYWDTDRLFREILAGMKRAGELGHRPRSVGIDTWGVDYALLDGDKRLLGKVNCYRSDRTAPVIPIVHGKVPFEELYSRTGIQFLAFNTVYQLAADLASGKLAGAQHLLMLPDYFHFLLTGSLSREYTNATTTALVNAHTHKWDGEVLRTLGYPERLFPEIWGTGSRLARLKKEVREFVGYDCEVVLPATHDTASAVTGSLEEGGPYLSSGTWSLLGILRPHAHTDERSRLFNYSNEGHPDGRFRLQKNIMGLWMIQRVRAEENDRYSFAELAQLAEREPCELTVDVNDERFMAPESMKRAVFEAVGRELTVGETASCVYRSLAKSYGAAVEELSAMTGDRYSSLNLIGGGCQNRLLNKLTAEETGLKVVAGPVEATAIGNLLVQMAAAGEISLKASPEIIRNSFQTEVVL